MHVVSNPLDEIREILIRYEAGEIGPPGADYEIMVILRRKGLATLRKIPPMQVGIHRKNRGGCIGASMGVRDLMDKIAKLHWNGDMCSHGICVELAEGDRTDEDAFRKWCEEAGSDYPAVEEGSLAFASLACSHTNCCLRLIVCRCASSNEKLGDGKNFSIDVIRKHDKAYALAAEEGLTWTVVPAVVLEWYPELVQLWSISRNTAGHVQQPVSEVTGMNLLYDLWTSKLAEGQKPCYETIVLNVTRGMPWWAGMIEEFIAYLARHAGGEGAGKLWKDFRNFHAHKVECEDRTMPAYVWAILATILQSRLAYGVLKAIYTCPVGKVENKRCVWVTTRELRDLAKKENMDQSASAEDFLVSVAALFTEGGTIHTRVIADASVDSSIKGFETVSQAKRTSAQMSTDIYSQTSIMVGRYMCSKPQDADFGSDTCDNLGDIAARLRRLVGG